MQDIPTESPRFGRGSNHFDVLMLKYVSDLIEINITGILLVQITLLNKYIYSLFFDLLRHMFIDHDVLLLSLQYIRKVVGDGEAARGQVHRRLDETAEKLSFLRALSLGT